MFGRGRQQQCRVHQVGDVLRQQQVEHRLRIGLEVVQGVRVAVLGRNVVLNDFDGQQAAGSDALNTHVFEVRVDDVNLLAPALVDRREKGLKQCVGDFLGVIVRGLIGKAGPRGSDIALTEAVEPHSLTTHNVRTYLNPLIVQQRGEGLALLDRR